MNNNLYRLLNNPAFDALQKIHEQFDNSALFSTMNELQRTLDMVKVPTSGITAALQTYQDSIAPLMSTVQNINNLYAPILEQTKKYEGVYNSSMVAVLQSSAAAMKAMAGLDFSAIENIANSLPKYDFLSESILRNIDFDDIVELYENGEITDDDIAGEFSDMVTQKDFSFVESWDKVKKAKWFLALRCVLIILTFLGKPAIDKVADNTLEALGVNEFWAESGIYEWLDDIFGFEKSSGTVTEQEAKETIQKENIGNVSKQNRDSLLSKIKEIRTYISAAPQDENTGNLLTYLSEIEKDVNGKKYGLIFEEHREEIDEVLATHTPVLSEEKDLLIDNGGNMNFLVEGDNLASLKLLEKTHKGKIDLIYIDPPYNRGKNDFRYNDKYINAEDTFKHSKWLSFMEKRLTVAKKLLNNNGVIFIHIDDNEQHALKLLCDEVFNPTNFMGVIIQNKLNSKNDSADIQKNHEYILAYRKMIQLNAEGKPTKLLSRIERKEKEVFKCDSGFYFINDFITTRGEGGVLVNRANLGYTVYYNPDTGDFFPEKDYDFEKALISDDEDFVYTTNDIHIKSGYVPIRPPKVRGKLGVWTWEMNKIIRDAQNVEIVKVRNRGYSIKSRTFVPEQDVRKKGDKFFYSGTFESNVKSIVEFSTNDGTTSLEEDIGKTGTFENPKNLDMMMYLINLLNRESPLVLDFFAGSGTTGRAILELNKLKLLDASFILCTNNENNICRDVTYERIKRVIDKENYAASLKYFKVEYVPISKRMYYEYADELLKHIRELVELENGVNFNDNAEIAIVLTEEELDSFVSSLGKDSRCCKLYMGHDLLPSGEQENILAAQGIKINIIPDYYYRDLQEG